MSTETFAIELNDKARKKKSNFFNNTVPWNICKWKKSRIDKKKKDQTLTVGSKPNLHHFLCDRLHYRFDLEQPTFPLSHCYWYVYAYDDLCCYFYLGENNFLLLQCRWHCFPNWYWSAQLHFWLVYYLGGLSTLFLIEQWLRWSPICNPNHQAFGHN